LHLANSLHFVQPVIVNRFLNPGLANYAKKLKNGVLKLWCVAQESVFSHFCCAEVFVSTGLSYPFQTFGLLYPSI